MSEARPSAVADGPRAEYAYGEVILPEREVPALRKVAVRVGFAVFLLVLLSVLVWLDRDGYTDTADGEVSYLDALYYSTVTLSTTGYGDVSPVSDLARLSNVFLVTPLRVLFLFTLVGTTVELLTKDARAGYRRDRWRKSVIAHNIVIGYGVKGRAAVQSLIDSGVPSKDIVVIESGEEELSRAKADGYTAITGSGADADILRQAEALRARRFIIAVKDDATAILATLNARRLNPTALIVTSVREDSNVDLARESGADNVITSSEAAGRIMGLAANAPLVGEVIEDLLSAGSGLELAQRPITPDEVGKSPREVNEPVIAVIRDGVKRRYDEPVVAELERGDQLVIARGAKGAAGLRRPRA